MTKLIEYRMAGVLFKYNLFKTFSATYTKFPLKNLTFLTQEIDSFFITLYLTTFTDTVGLCSDCFMYSRIFDLFPRGLLWLCDGNFCDSSYVHLTFNLTLSSVIKRQPTLVN